MKKSKVVERLRVNLVLAISRLQLAQQKRTALSAAQHPAIAKLLAAGKTESARVRVEALIRDDLLGEALEALELCCELVVSRIGLVTAGGGAGCDPSLVGPVATIIYGSHRVDVPELTKVRDVFAALYGKTFVQEQSYLGGVESPQNVSDKVVRKLRVEIPERRLVGAYLSEIARSYKVPFDQEAEEPESSEKDCSNALFQSESNANASVAAGVATGVAIALVDRQKHMDPVQEDANNVPSYDDLMVRISALRGT